MGLMKYQLGISGEIVSFFLEFDHAWDAGKARERERERDGKTLFLPLPHHSLLSSWYSRINIESTSLSPWQHTREAEYTPELRDRETTSHHTISLCRSVCERKILCQKKKNLHVKILQFFCRLPAGAQGKKFKFPHSLDVVISFRCHVFFL